MLLRIAAHAISAYARPSDLALDPMCVIGTTLVEAIHLGRSVLGVEYEPPNRRAPLARYDPDRRRFAARIPTVTSGAAGDVRPVATPGTLPQVLRTGAPLAAPPKPKHIQYKDFRPTAEAVSRWMVTSGVAP
ncbi:hypothetical protein AB0478_34175 [Streptomyces sp. NPDC051917]|uniref:hypothetical protein n=1 Tax=Streptomyces sp. NPDC051917 TaxID=3154754 RepID=UPI003450120E